MQNLSVNIKLNDISKTVYDFIVRLNCSILCSTIITRLFLLLIEPAVNVPSLRGDITFPICITSGEFMSGCHLGRAVKCHFNVILW